jgi:hypothetical protein
MSPEPLIVHKVGHDRVLPLAAEESVDVRPKLPDGRSLASYVDWQIPVLACLLAIVTYATGERIGFNNGLGWDGAIYAKWARDFHHEAFDTGIDAYRIQRILPAVVTHYVLRGLGMSLTDKHILHCFAAINVLSITIVAIFWVRIANRLKIGTQGKWLGFAALFLNYAVLKNTSFNPVLTDMPAYAVSAGMVWAYLGRRQVALFAMSAIGAWVWPTLIYLGAILALFPRNPEGDSHDFAAPLRLNVIGAGLLTLYAGLGVCYMFSRLGGPMFGFLEPIRPVVRLSVVIVLAYMFFGCRSLLDTQALFDVRRWVSWSQLGTLVALAAMIVLVKTAQAALTDRPGYMAFNVYLMVIGVGAVAKPGVFLVAHIVYFGPWLIVAAMIWKPLCRLLHQYGLGLTLAVVIGFVHGLDSESRHEIYLVPLLVPFFVKATESLGWKTGTYAIVSGFCAFGSEAWLNMKGTFVDNAFLYPDQLYWMHHGPFMSPETYLAHLGGAVALGALLYIVCFHGRQQLADYQAERDSGSVGLAAGHGHWQKISHAESPFRSAAS